MLQQRTEPRPKIDYSQYGQAVLLEALITEDTPTVVVDIGANDGISGSNSRALLEVGWTGVLVEPLPRVFEKLKSNSSRFPSVRLLQTAVSNERGLARMYIGRDGEMGQMSSLSQDPLLLANLTEQVMEVPTATLAEVLASSNVPEDFGVLLVDAEGWDVVVLQGLEHTSKRPRIIVTENFSGTNDAKYRLLDSYGYQCVGFWGGDSFWVYRTRQQNVPNFAPAVDRCSPKWTPEGTLRSVGAATLDQAACFQTSIAGWAWVDINEPPPSEIFVKMRRQGTDETATFKAWRTPRPDVAVAFKSDALFLSGFRLFCDVSGGVYELTVVQKGPGYFTEICIGSMTVSA